MNRCAKAFIIDKDQNYVHTERIFWYTNSKIPEETTITGTINYK